MASNAKQIFGYEHTANGLQPMDEERYRAFLQEGIDAIDRGDVVDHSVIKADVELMRADARARLAR